MISITCVGDTATIRYRDDKWGTSVCLGDGSGGPGSFKKDYTLDADKSLLDGDGKFEVTCQGDDGDDPNPDFGTPEAFVLKDDGSLKWYGAYDFWRTSTN